LVGWFKGKGVQGTHNTAEPDLVSHSLEDKIKGGLHIQILAASSFSSKA